MVDMAASITANSSQLNADDLVGGPRTITITRVKGSESREQPISIFYEGDDGKPYMPCKSMRRVMVGAWGLKADAYVGRSMTLYRDPDVKFGGIMVGGIRISHMSDIDGEKVLALTVTRGSKKPFTVRPLGAKKSPPPPAPPPPPPASPPVNDGIDMGGDDEPVGFPFTLCDKNGKEHLFRGDGAKWRDILIAAMSKAFDVARATWDANEEYVKAAEEAGQEAFARPVREAWQKRKVDASGAAG